LGPSRFLLSPIGEDKAKIKMKQNRATLLINKLVQQGEIEGFLEY
jgi:hypothetical protein